MKINEIIKQYRKAENLTQEQIANYLGVTAPAVNKWENGISYPDITLLAPLARILKTDVDTLLSFHEELSELEMNQIFIGISEHIKDHGYDAGFIIGEEAIKNHPNCDLLRLHTAELLNAYLTMNKIQDTHNYDKKILGWFEIVLTGKDPKVAAMAKASLVTYYMNKGEYDKAQHLLDEIDSIDYDKQFTQALLYEKQSRNEEALEQYEKIMFKNANQIISILQLICRFQYTNKKFAEAEKYANLNKEFALLLDLGKYNAYTANFLLAIERKDTEQTIDLLEIMIDGIDTMEEYQNSWLYSHMKFNKLDHIDDSKDLLKKTFLKNDELDFIREEPRAKKLFLKLGES